MRFLIKFLIFLGIIAGAAWGIARVPSLKQKTVEIVNPAAKEKRLLADLASNLDALEKALPTAAATARQSATPPGQVAGAQELIDESREIIKEIAEINDTKSSVASATSGRIIELAREAKRAFTKTSHENAPQPFSFQDESGASFLCSPR